MIVYNYNRYMLTQDKSFLAPVYKPSLVVKNAAGDYIYDIKGKKYIDFTSGIAVNALGHGHNSITKAITQQLKEIIHCSNYFVSKPTIELCNTLCKIANNSFATNDFTSTYLSNSGTEANEAALKFSRIILKKKYKGKEKTQFISFTSAFHGRTMGSLSVTAKEKYKTHCKPLIPNCILLPFNNSSTLKKTVSDSLAAIIVEPIQGEGGLSIMSQSFAKTIREIANKYNAIVIADEVQSGLYRCGFPFLSENTPLHPDIITLAKSLGGGLPIGATIIKHHITKYLAPGDHGSTMGGNPVVSAAALAVLTQLFIPSIQKAMRHSEVFLSDSINKIATQYNLKALGHGHLRGLQFTKNTSDKTISHIISLARKKGLLILRTGDRALRIAPSLICPLRTIKDGMKILEKTLHSL